MNRVPTVVLIGAGRRGRAYAKWLHDNPTHGRLVGVAEPHNERRAEVSELHGLNEGQVFDDWRALARSGRLADGAIVATQDTDHVEPATAMAASGYGLMVEKPMATTEWDCVRLVRAVIESGVLFTVCHVLRYSILARAIKSMLDSGRIGRVRTIRHLEPIGLMHFAHSYVRGSWSNVAKSAPTLLTKSCHDIDIMRYFVGSDIKRVSSFGELSYFTSENLPKGAGPRCTECRVEPDCGFSAQKMYLEPLRNGDVSGARSILAEPTEGAVIKELREGSYGRCVFDGDNDALESQVIAMEFESGATGTFTMTAFAPRGPRVTEIHGTHGVLSTDGTTIDVVDLRNGTRKRYGTPDDGQDHASGLRAEMIKAFLSAISRDDQSVLTASPLESLRSHLAVFAAERARISGVVESVRTFDLYGADVGHE